MRMRLSIALGTALAVLVGAVIAARQLALNGKPKVREFVLVAKDMKFNDTNPTLEVRLGDTVKITVRNKEEGRMVHALAIEAFGVETKILRPGQSQTVTFVANKVGTFKYVCPFHRPMMDGEFVVKER